MANKKAAAKKTANKAKAPKAKASTGATKSRYTKDEDTLIRSMVKDNKTVSEIKTALKKEMKVDRSTASLNYRIYRVLTKKKPSEIKYSDD